MAGCRWEILLPRPRPAGSGEASSLQALRISKTQSIGSDTGGSALEESLTDDASALSDEPASRDRRLALGSRVLRRTVVVDVPKSRVRLLSQEYFEPPIQSRRGRGAPASPGPLRLTGRLLYRFHTDFYGHAISVSTARSEYTKLREMLGYLSSGGPSAAGASDFDDLVYGPRRRFEEDRRNPNEPSFVLKPELNILGESTSAVLDWFLQHVGVERENLPGILHESVADPLEAVLAQLFRMSRRVDAVVDA